MMEKMELQVKISVDTSELDSAIKKAKRLGAILRSIEKRVDNIAKKKEGIDQGFTVEHAPVNAFSFKKLIDDFNIIHQPGISDEAWKKVIDSNGVDYVIKRNPNRDIEYPTPARCVKCMETPAVINLYERFRIQCECIMAEGSDLVSLIDFWNEYNK